MGSYNSQYESYYNGIVNKRKGYNGYSSSYNSKPGFQLTGNFIIRRIYTDLIGTLVLFALVIMCKIVVTPQTEAVYNYSKDLVDKNYDYTLIAEKARGFNFQEFQQKITDNIDSIKSKISGGSTIKAKIQRDYILPAEGKVITGFGERIDPATNEREFHDGIDLDVKEGTEVMASFNGKVKDCGEDAVLGNYILIDHGSGIETKYANLKEILVKKDDVVNKGQIIAKSGSTGKTTVPVLHYELIYMGENTNPEEYFSINN